MSIIRKELYNKVSFVIRGDTEFVEGSLKRLGGRWNPNLKNGPGWLFNIKKHTASVSEFFDSIKKDENEDDDQEEEEEEQENVQITFYEFTLIFVGLSVFFLSVIG